MWGWQEKGGVAEAGEGLQLFNREEGRAFGEPKCGKYFVLTAQEERVG